MRKYVDRKTIALAAAALMLVLAISAGSAMAYFTTYASAGGGIEVSLGSTVTIPKENVVDYTKQVTIMNTGGHDCFVRVKVFAGEAYQQGLTYTDESGKWSLGEDGYYYYSDVVPAGGSTNVLNVAFKDVIENMAEPKDFNIIVVQESTLAVYDESGNPTADWNRTVDSSQNSYTVSEGGGK